jgi:hypothetical protein
MIGDNKPLPARRPADRLTRTFKTEMRRRARTIHLAPDTTHPDFSGSRSLTTQQESNARVNRAGINRVVQQVDDEKQAHSAPVE